MVTNNATLIFGVSKFCLASVWIKLVMNAIIREIFLNYVWSWFKPNFVFIFEIPLYVTQLIKNATK